MLALSLAQEIMAISMSGGFGKLGRFRSLTGVHYLWSTLAYRVARYKKFSHTNFAIENLLANDLNKTAYKV